MEYSPVILFVYNRPDNTLKTLEALANNEGANKTDLFVFADAAKSPEDKDSVESVREIIRKISGFKSVSLRLRRKNYGLAKNIIEGVTEVSKKYPQFIVLEDDMLTSPYFLNFMNLALHYYKNNKNIWHISGGNHPIKTNGLADIFLFQVPLWSWGWATWSNRWKFFEKNTEELIAEFNDDDINRFNLNLRNTDIFWSQVIGNKKGTINTWAVYWYATVFKKNGISICPSKTYVKNIGRDGTGVHREVSSMENNNNLSIKKRVSFKVNEISNQLAIKRLRAFYKKTYKRSFFRKVISRLLPRYLKCCLKSFFKL